MTIHRNAVPLEMLDDTLSALVEAGSYNSKNEVIVEALNALLDANSALRLEMAIILWRDRKITLSRAVEIAQSDHESFKEEIAKRGLYIEIDMSPEEVKRQAQSIPHLRPSA